MIRTDTRIALGLGILLAIYLGSNELARWLIEWRFDVRCAVRFLSLGCAYPADSGYSAVTYAILAAVMVAMVAVTSVFLRENVVTPFFQLMGAIGIGVICYDMLFHRPVLTSTKIINDTENILSFVIFASFTLTLIILRNGRVPLHGIALAGLASYSIKVVMMFIFLSMSARVMGATELYMLYVAYAFGTFTIHIMTISALVARAALAPITAEG